MGTFLLLIGLLYVLGYVVFVIKLTLETPVPVTVEDLVDNLGWSLLWPLILLMDYIDSRPSKPYDSEESKEPTRWQKFMGWELMK